MLRHLSIHNYVLISSLEMDFHAGFSSITGETGSGKSIILGALGLIMGQRADSKAISEGAQKCVIEADFDISLYPLQEFFQESDLDYDPEHCVVRRELSVNGKSRCFINDTPVTLAQLKQLTGQLIDIHSQHENLLLGANHFQLDVLDTLAQNKAEKEAYKSAYDAFRKAQGHYNSLRENIEKQKADADYIRFQFNQLHEANLQPDEEMELESQLNIMEHTEEIKTSLAQIVDMFENDEQGILPRMKFSANLLNKTLTHYAELQNDADRLESAYIELKDLAAGLADRFENMEFDPQQLQFLQDRYNLLNTLMQKHSVRSTRELIALYEQYDSQLQNIDNADEAMEEARRQLEQAQQVMQQAAQVLSETRQKAIHPIELRLVEQLRALGIQHPQFQVQLSPVEHPQESGMDEVTFLFAANKNQTMRNVAEVASGGEIARLMLCFKALLAEKQALPTIIFDEIDTGVSGEVADNIARIMQQMGTHMQVLAITHLPQIAAKGNTHYKVYKKDTEERTETFIKQLLPDERVREIAQMLSGASITEAALENARMLLEAKE